MYLLKILRDVDIDWNSGDGSTNTSDSSLISMINDFLQSYKSFVIGVLGLADLTMIAIFIWLCINLSAGSTNFTGKNTNGKRLLLWCIGMALLGSINLIVCLLYNAFRG